MISYLCYMLVFSGELLHFEIFFASSCGLFFFHLQKNSFRICCKAGLVVLNSFLVVVVTNSCLTLLWPHGLWSPPGSSVSGISLARILEWIAISFSRSSQPRDWTHIPCIGRQILYGWATWEVLLKSCSICLSVKLFISSSNLESLAK